MIKIEDGGPAFPTIRSEYNFPHQAVGIFTHQTGMSLRDWFAGMALIGFVERLDPDCCDESIPFDLIAELCGKFADAMLKERKQKEGNL